MRRKRGLIALLLVLVMVLAACGGDDDDDTAADDGDDTETTSGDGEAREVEPGPGFDGTTITLGVITPQTGPAAVIGNPLLAGNQVFIDALNAKGGVAGKYKIKLEIRDSQYLQPLAVQAYSAMKGSVAAFLQVMGTSINKALLPQFTRDGFLAGPASLDADWVREPNLMAIGGPYQIQTVNGVNYFLTEGGGEGKKVCALTVDDAYGEAALSGLEFAAEELDFEIAARATFKPGDSDFTAQLGKLQGCEAVWLTALPTETAKILAGAAQAGFTPRWLAQSPTWVAAFAKSPLAPYMQQYVWVVVEGPQWGDTSVPGMKQMLDDIQAHKPDQPPDIYFAFGYAQAWGMSQILEAAVARGDLSPKGILDAAASIEELTFGDLLGDYAYGAAEDRDPPRRSTVFSVDPAAPGGLKALKTNFESEAAKRFTFDE